MAISDMQKVHMAVHKTISDEVMGRIQKLGCCQFIARSHESVDERDIAPLRTRLRKIEELLGEARFVSRFLEPFATEKGSGLARAMGDMPSYSLDALSKVASEDTFKTTSCKLRDLEKRLSDARTGMSRVTGLVAQLKPLAQLPYSLDFYTTGTEETAGNLFSVPLAQADALKSALGGALGEMLDLYALPTSEKDTSQLFSVIFPREKAADVQNAMHDITASRIDVPAQLKDTAANELVRLDEEYGELKLSEETVVDEITAMANDAYKECQLFSDYWTIQKNRADALIDGEQTEQILLVSFWIPKTCMARFTQATSLYQDLIDVVTTDPEEGELPPTLLRNKGLAEPMEPLITMYGTPTYGAFDPTGIVTPFFYLFFGMCFGDAGYGLVIAGILLLILMRKPVTGTLKKFLVILTVSNLMAVVVGTLTFSWFGDSITAFPFLSFLKPLGALQVLDPMNDPMTFLGISLSLGFIQILVGLFIAMRENIRSGNKFAAFADQGGWVIFLCGLVLLGLSSAGMLPLPTSLAGAIAAVGAIILVATQGREKPSIFGKLFSGVMSLYNVTGYLGDVLSYSRLLALGLGSAAVGMVINLLCNLVAGAGPVGIVLAVVIFVVGHTFSIAVNILGAFVHSLRLQYVEFFGKFYEASGEDFTPLTMSTQYVKLTD
ncbi:V-type ATP synthase subunit I [Synergistaceae bacterium OttesenSCG-928-I11]|nr:V-type ATP synthase subunit I [Synergistaceae bacterium OttesenSCG-928-I11]